MIGIFIVLIPAKAIGPWTASPLDRLISISWPVRKSERYRLKIPLNWKRPTSVRMRSASVSSEGRVAVCSATGKSTIRSVGARSLASIRPNAAFASNVWPGAPGTNPNLEGSGRAGLPG